MLTETPLGNKHIVSARQFDKDWLEKFLFWVDRHQNFMPLEDYHRRHGTTVYMLFYEPSTRTRFSFTHAAHDLGMNVISTENAREFSSAVKGESLEDTIRVCCENGADIIVLRHPEAFSARRAEDVVEKYRYKTKIINAGDGANEHPTQALTDLYTIWADKGRVQDLNILVGGDLLHGRAARSLIFQHALFPGNRFIFFSPRAYGVGEDVKDFLRERGCMFREEDLLSEESLKTAEVVYWTRPQLERHTRKGLWSRARHFLRIHPFARPQRQYVFSTNELSLLSHEAIILHPLPRTEELPVEIDADPRARYFAQVGYGKLVRTALMMYMLNGFPQGSL
jgi:aspartate carbamoyltransferase catalytic subunit